MHPIYLYDVMLDAARDEWLFQGRCADIRYHNYLTYHDFWGQVDWYPIGPAPADNIHSRCHFVCTSGVSRFLAGALRSEYGIWSSLFRIIHCTLNQQSLLSGPLNAEHYIPASLSE